MTRKISLGSFAAVLAASLPALHAQAQPDLAAMQAPWLVARVNGCARHYR